jgi:hypothetical protein
LLLFLSGCQKPTTLTTSDDFVSPLKPAEITYTELASRYNAAIEPFDSLWSRADVEIEWIELESDGDRRFRSESGNGKFIMRRAEIPADVHETAMTVEKLGKIYLWAGSNRDGYYLFDRVDSDNKTLYTGTYLGLAEGRAKAFPLPIQPGMVPALLGLTPLQETSTLGREPTIDRYGDQYMLDDPARGVRMLIDPDTFRPSRVDLVNREGYSILTAKLSGRLVVDGETLADGTPLLLCEKAEIYVAGYETRFTLDFGSATTSTRRVRDQMFDIDALSKVLKPDQVIDLDQP